MGVGAQNVGPLANTQRPPHPTKPTFQKFYGTKTLQVIRDIHKRGGGVQYFVDGMLNRRAMYRFAVPYPTKERLLI